MRGTMRGSSSSSSLASTSSKSSKEGTGSSNSCSAICGSGRTVRCRMASWKVILGTSITCSGTTVSSGLSTSTSWSTVCGTGASSSGTSGTQSTISSTVRRCTRSCGSTSSNGAGRPAAGASPTSSPASIAKCWAPAAWGVGCSGTWPCRATRSPPGPCHSLSPWS